MAGASNVGRVGPRVSTARDVRGFFHEEVRRVLGRHRVRVEEGAEAYVVNLLADYTHAERLFDPGRRCERGLPALALQLARAAEEAPRQRAATLRRVGDSSLYVSGFFSDSLSRGPVDIDYYVEVGRSAYAGAAALLARRASGAALGPVLSAVARHFVALVDCLMDLSESFATTRTDDPVRGYERYLHTGSPREGRRLVARGLIPHRPAGMPQ